MLRHLSAIFAMAILLVACQNGMNSKDKVQAAIMDRIQNKTGLDLKGLDVTTTSVSFEKNMAYATVAFHPKGDSSVGHGMEMKYTLEQHDGQWQVVNVSDPHGNPARSPSSDAGGQLPPGHPSVQGAPPGHTGMAPGAHEGGQAK